MRRVATLLATLVLGLTLFTPTATAATQVKVLQLNICHSGVAGCYTGDRVMTKAISVITSVRPQVLSVNEACSGDISRLRAAMGPSRVMFVAAGRPDGSPVTCVNGEQYGNIVMVADPLAGLDAVVGLYSAQDNSSERRGWACLRAGQVNACSTHLSAYSGSTALAQCKELMAFVTGFPGPTVVSGDMNLRYQGSPNVQDCNPSGYYRKGDGALQHVFAPTSLAFVSSQKIGMSGTTDHPAWVVTTSMN